ncbi:MAG: hypothetical protein IKZ56_08225 [Bacteroidales bacterium]|nr:hypothetical protein [Bacteroidales bacterium]
MILSKTKTIEERRFYIQLCADLQLSHEALDSADSRHRNFHYLCLR